MATSLGKVGIRNRGRFDALATYAAGDYVYYMGSTFLALQNLPAGMVPQHDGINWNYLAEGASVEQVLQNFAPIEDGATASQAYSAGSYLLHEDILYKTTTDIASGGAITIGTNITPVTIGEEMHSLAKNFANEEDSATATMNYSVGQYLVYNEHFYRVTSAITTGQTLTPGTNIEATTVGTQLTSINDSFTNVRTVTANTTYISNNWLSMIKIGRMVIVSGRFTVATQKPAGQSDYLFSVPAPQGVIAPVYTEGPSGHLPYIIINSDGLLTSNNAVPTGNYNVFAAYISVT